MRMCVRDVLCGIRRGTTSATCGHVRFDLQRDCRFDCRRKGKTKIELHTTQTTVTITSRSSSRAGCRIMMDLPDDVFDHVLRALDPGLDWVACRFVCRRWHERILAVTPYTFMWMAPLRLLLEYHPCP